MWMNEYLLETDGRLFENKPSDNFWYGNRDRTSSAKRRHGRQNHRRYCKLLAYPPHGVYVSEYIFGQCTHASSKTSMYSKQAMNETNFEKFTKNKYVKNNKLTKILNFENLESKLIGKVGFDTTVACRRRAESARFPFFLIDSAVICHKQPNFFSICPEWYQLIRLRFQAPIK